MTQFFRLSLIAAAMTAFLVAMLASHLDRRANGAEILLEVEGYDPRDILLGHYAEIRTPLQRFDIDALEGDDSFERGDRIYVVLETGADGLAIPIALHRAHPGSGLVAQGRVTGASETASARQDADPAWVHARFNIERYYASRSRALELQERLRQFDESGATGVRLILSAPADGRLIIKGFEIDGERRIDRIW